MGELGAERQFAKSVSEISESEERIREDSTCTRLVYFPIVKDLEDSGIPISGDTYTRVASRVKDRSLLIGELCSHRSDFYLDGENRVAVRVMEEFYRTSSRDRKVILVYGSREDRERFAELEGLKR